MRKARAFDLQYGNAGRITGARRERENMDSMVVRLIFSEDEKYPLCLEDYETLVAVATKQNTTVEALVADAVSRAICGGLADCLGSST